MIAAHVGRAARRGITLTEILISIMIMGIGIISLATLFPLGLLRIREAARATRSAMLAQSAISDLTASGLLNKPFYSSLYGYDPFLQDPGPPPNQNQGLFAGYGTGFPVCIDPLWWFQIETQSNGATSRLNTEARFGSGIGFLRNAPDNGLPGAHGLPRVSPFQIGVDPTSFFASIDDLVYQEEGNANPSGGVADLLDGVGSTVVPAMTPNGPLGNISFTWLFTGRQTDIGNALTFDGDIVIMHNRPFSIDPATGAYGGTARPANEFVVEAIWGYGAPVTNPGYSPNLSTVLLRWPATQTDPDIRIGGWIADVTYERFAGVAANRYGFPASEPAQRCHWYRVVRKGEVTIAPAYTNDSGAYKQIIINIDRPVRSRSLLNAGTPPTPAFVETALVSPNVVMVYPRVVVVK